MPGNGPRLFRGDDRALGRGREGVAQSCEIADSLTRLTLLGAVGVLQFDVLQYRLESEYGAKSRRESAPWSVVRWVREKAPSDDAATPKKAEGTRPKLQLPTGSILARDDREQWMVLLPNEWTARYLAEKNEGFEMLPVPPRR